MSHGTIIYFIVHQKKSLRLSLLESVLRLLWNHSLAEIKRKDINDWKVCVSKHWRCLPFPPWFGIQLLLWKELPVVYRWFPQRRYLFSCANSSAIVLSYLNNCESNGKRTGKCFIVSWHNHQHFCHDNTNSIILREDISSRKTARQGQMAWRRCPYKVSSCGKTFLQISRGVCF